MIDIRLVLQSFDRKERAWLVRNALGCPQLSSKFLQMVSEKLQLDPPLASDAWWGVDYHLDWLVAALISFRTEAFPHPSISTAIKNDGQIHHTIQDVDLIIADSTRIILIEAKAFDEWKSAQLAKKAARLGKLTQSGRIQDVRGANSIDIYFAITSLDSEPLRLDLDSWPDWALRAGKPLWFELDTSHEGMVYRPVRCDANGKPYYRGTHWVLMSQKAGGRQEVAITSPKPA